MEVTCRGPEFSSNPVSLLQAIAPGPTRVLATSASVSWRGLLVEEHLTSPGERISASIDRTVITLNIGPASRFEYRNNSGGFVACLNRPGTVMGMPPGPLPDFRLHTLSEFLHCALDNNLLASVADEFNGETPAACAFRPAIQDKSIRCLLGLLKDELETNAPVGSLYVDAIAHALAVRYLRLDATASRCSNKGISPLPPRMLARVRDQMEAHLDSGVSLESLAEASGYSRAHFLKMFRAATGITPHQFLLDLRIKRAQDSLRCKNTSIVEIALSCGFSSQSHMTSIFRQRLEVTPAGFRRSANPNSLSQVTSIESAQNPVKSAVS